MSKISKLSELLRGTHVMGDSSPTAGLRDYHAAKSAIDAGRKRDIGERCAAIKSALKNHNVTVSIRDDDICVRRTVGLTEPRSFFMKAG